MKIEIKDDELAYIIHSLMQAISYVNKQLRDGIESSHPERRSTTWWDNFKSDVDVARTLSALLDKIENPQS